MTVYAKGIVFVLVGRFTSQLGGAFFTLLMSYWILDFTGSAIWMGTVATIAQIALIVSGPIAGAIADTTPRKRLVIISDIIRALTLLIFAGAVWYDGAKFALPALIFTTVVMSATGALLAATLVPLVADIVSRERLAPALSAARAAFYLGDILGKGIGGVVYPLTGIAFSLSIDAFLYIIGASIFSAVIIAPSVPRISSLGSATLKENFGRSTAGDLPKLPAALEVKKAPRKVPSIFKEAIRGLRYVAKDSNLILIFSVLAIINFFVAPVAVLIPIFAKYTLEIGPQQLGFLIAAQSGGSLLGFASIMFIPWISRERPLMIAVSLLFLGISFAIVPLSSRFYYTICCFVAQGLLISILNVSITALLDCSADGSMRGRVQALANTVGSVLMPVSSALSGIVAEVTNKDVSLMWIVCGAVCMASAAIFWRVRDRLRNKDGAEGDAVSVISR